MALVTFQKCSHVTDGHITGCGHVSGLWSRYRTFFTSKECVTDGHVPGMRSRHEVWSRGTWAAMSLTCAGESTFSAERAAARVNLTVNVCEIPEHVNFCAREQLQDERCRSQRSEERARAPVRSQLAAISARICASEAESTWSTLRWKACHLASNASDAPITLLALASTSSTRFCDCPSDSSTACPGSSVSNLPKTK